MQLEERQTFLEDVMRQSATLDNVRAEVIDGDSAATDATRQEALAKQREALEEERRRYTEAAVKLGKDRTELEVRRLRWRCTTTHRNSQSDLHLLFDPAKIAGGATPIPRGETFAADGGPHRRPSADARPSDS